MKDLFLMVGVFSAIMSVPAHAQIGAMPSGSVATPAPPNAVPPTATPSNPAPGTAANKDATSTASSNASVRPEAQPIGQEKKADSKLATKRREKIASSH